MTGTGQAGSDFFRRWLESNAWALGGGAGPLWQTCEHLHTTWARFAEGLAGAHAARHGGPDASPFDPAGWLRGPGEGGMADLFRWLEGEGLSGPLGAQAQAMKGTREWLAYLAATEQMKAVLAEGWLAAFRAFLERAADEADAAETAGEAPDPTGLRDDWQAAPAAPGWDRLVEIWREAAADELARLQRGPAFLAAQRDLIRAETALRRAVRERIEQVATELGLPTRAELDDLHETVHGLAREMRRMRARARAAEAPTDPDPESP